MTTVMNWQDQAQQEFFEIPGFVFDRGGTLDLRIAYRTLGERAADGRNGVLMLHGTTESGAQYLEQETGDALFGPDRPLDIGKYYVVLPDAIGHGASSKPSDGLGEAFPKYTYADMVNAHHRLVCGPLHLQRLRLVIGASMGGMHTWMWGIQWPEMMDALMPIASLPERLSGRNLLFRRIMVDLVRSDPVYASGHPKHAVPGIGKAWNMFDLMTLGASYMSSAFVDPTKTDQWLQRRQQTAMQHQHPTDVIWEFEASVDYDPSPHLSRITAPLLAVNFADDIVNDESLGGLERAMAKLSNARGITLPAEHDSNGHQRLRETRLWTSWLEQLMRDTDATQ